jgi:phospholipid/cholesterol/gamma-HCH transport system permease protein
MASAASILAVEEAGALVLRAGGDWLVGEAGDLDRRLQAIKLPGGRRVLLDLAGVDRLDTAGAWLLLRTEHDLAERGNDVAVTNVRPSFAPLIAQLREHGRVSPLPHPIPTTPLSAFSRGLAKSPQ